MAASIGVAAAPGGHHAVNSQTTWSHVALQHDRQGSRAEGGLQKADILAYPGVISGWGGRSSVARVVVSVEATRIRLGVSAAGHQELLVYGAVDPSRMLAAISTVFPATAVSVRDPGQLWAAAVAGPPANG